MTKPTHPYSNLLAACIGFFLLAANLAFAQPAAAPAPQTSEGTTEAAAPSTEASSVITTMTPPETPQEAAERKRAEAEEKKRAAREAAEEKKRERARQCQIKPVMTDAQIQLCKEVWR